MPAQTKKPITKSPRRKQVKADRNKIVDLVINKGVTQEQASKLTGTSQSRISEILSQVKQNPEYLEFQENKDKVFEGLQAKLCNLADDATLKTMLSKRGMTDVAILEDKIRLIRGQATDITDVQIRGLIAHFTVPKIAE